MPITSGRITVIPAGNPKIWEESRQLNGVIPTLNFNLFRLTNPDVEGFCFYQNTTYIGVGPLLRSPFNEDMIIRENDRPLFSNFLLSERLSELDEKLRLEINAIDADSLLKTSLDDICDSLVTKYSLIPVTFDETKIYQESPKDCKVDVRGDSYRIIFDKSRPAYVWGTSITVHIPFNGDGELLLATPATRIGDPPRATHSNAELTLTFTRTDHDGLAVQEAYKKELDKILQWSGYINSSVEQYNSSLRHQVRNLIESRRQKLLQDREMAESLGIPIRRRDDAPSAYTFPIVRRAVPITPLAANIPKFQPEWELAMEEYEHILGVLGYMGEVMERIPAAFIGMQEEHLRAHFLVQLNGQYQGQATGETFNLEGKTDIFLQFEGRAAFIAECKFWGGQEQLQRDLNQLLGYSTWRNSKVALLVFNRRKNFTSVLNKLDEGLRHHPNFKRQMDYISERGFRGVYHHRDDPDRDIIITSLAFEIPG